MSLRLFLDTADLQAWQQWLPSGLFHGITCNPTLLRRAGHACSLQTLRELTNRALDLGAAELHLQAWGGHAEAYAACGEQLASFAPGRMVVKLPLTADGLLAGRHLIASGVPVTMTACYAAHQVLPAAALGAAYVAPYLGRICDLGRDGHAELIQMQRCLTGIGSSLRLLVASLRSPSDLTVLAAAGLSTFTISPQIATAMLAVDASQDAASQFERDALAQVAPSLDPA